MNCHYFDLVHDMVRKDIDERINIPHCFVGVIKSAFWVALVDLLLRHFFPRRHRCRFGLVASPWPCLDREVKLDVD